MKNNNIIFYSKSFSKLDVVIYVAFIWCAAAIIAIISYNIKNQLIAWPAMVASIILLLILYLLCKNSKQEITLYNDRIDINIPKHDSILKSARAINTVSLTQLSTIYIADAKRGHIIIEYDNCRTEIKFITHADELIRRVTELTIKQREIRGQGSL